MSERTKKFVFKLTEQKMKKFEENSKEKFVKWGFITKEQKKKNYFQIIGKWK